MPQRTKDWIAAASHYAAPEHADESVNRYLFVSMLASDLATLGDWDHCEAMINNLSPDRAAETCCTCIDIAGRFLAADADALLAIVSRLAGVPNEADANKRAACFARAARVLGRTQGTASRKFLGQAVELCLTTLPEDGLDSILELLAIAQHEDGDHAAAEETMRRMKLPSSVTEALSNPVAAGPGSQPSDRDAGPAPVDLDSTVNQIRAQIDKVRTADKPPAAGAPGRRSFIRLLDECTPAKRYWTTCGSKEGG